MSRKWADAKEEQLGVVERRTHAPSTRIVGDAIVVLIDGYGAAG
jgi:hypothetical protein